MWLLLQIQKGTSIILFRKCMSGAGGFQRCFGSNTQHYATLSETFVVKEQWNGLFALSYLSRCFACAAISSSAHRLPSFALLKWSLFKILTAFANWQPGHLAQPEGWRFPARKVSCKLFSGHFTCQDMRHVLVEKVHALWRDVPCLRWANLHRSISAMLAIADCQVQK